MVLLGIQVKINKDISVIALLIEIQAIGISICWKAGMLVEE